MKKLFITIFLALVLFLVYQIIVKWVLSRREKLIDIFDFPQSINQKIMAKYPHLNQRAADVVIRNLRERYYTSLIGRSSGCGGGGGDSRDRSGYSGGCGGGD